jgi:hypothetical protein
LEELGVNRETLEKLAAWVGTKLARKEVSFLVVSRMVS